MKQYEIKEIHWRKRHIVVACLVLLQLVKIYLVFLSMCNRVIIKFTSTT